jgi:tetratricopeptide (TPR) repeat protein
LLAGATLIAYLPALQGAFVWDDAGHVTRPDLQSLDGLRRSRRISGRDPHRPERCRVAHHSRNSLRRHAGAAPGSHRGTPGGAADRPDFAEAHNNLGSALSQLPARFAEAIAEYQDAIRIRPDFAEAQYNLGVALAAIPGRLPEAIEHLDAALRLRPDWLPLRQTLDRLRAAPAPAPRPPR